MIIQYKTDGGDDVEIVVSNKASSPLYEQIATQIKAAIMSGELKAGEAIPSVRALAKSLHISILTVQKHMRLCKRMVSLKRLLEKVVMFLLKIKISIWRNSRKR